MDEYNPTMDIDPDEWMDIDEFERIVLVRDYHRAAKVKLPNAQMHATIHVMVENQIALGDDIPVEKTLKRLQGEGLDRHEAIHAIGCVLSEFMFTMMEGKKKNADPNQDYYRALEKLTAQSWVKEYGG